MTSGLLVERLVSGAEEDLRACLAIEKASFSKEQLDFSAELARDYAHLWVVREAPLQAPLGFLLAWYLAGELEIQTVAVDPARRRSGAGRALVVAALAAARALRCERVLLEVRAGNEPALELYRKAGFSEDGRRRAYYSEPTEDAVLMSLML